MAAYSVNKSYTLLLILSIVVAMLTKPVISKAQPATTDELYIALLIDGSLSMRDTDPLNYRKIASQAILTMMSPKDNISVVQFSSEPEVFIDWTKADNINTIIPALDAIKADGTTDFYLALKKMAELFKQVPSNARKVIILFSDGALEPNPYSIEYSPLHLQYRSMVLGKSQKERSEIYREFKNKIIPVAESKINNLVLPELKSLGVEIFSVAFSNDADKLYLGHLANETNRKEIEQRLFYVDKATDILEVFMSLLPFWQNKVLLHKEEGISKGLTTQRLFIDEFVKDIFCIALYDQRLTFNINPINFGPEKTIIEGQENISIFQLTGAPTPNTWETNISGNGDYKYLIIGESTIRIEVENLKPRYYFGEEAEVIVKVLIGDQDGRNFLRSHPRIKASLEVNNKLIDSLYLSENENSFIFKYNLSSTGAYKVIFTLTALDSDGRDLLPRPSREYQFQVLPEFSIRPAHISFGTIKRGRKGDFHLEVRNGLNQERKLTASAIINSHNRKKLSEGLPEINAVLISPPFTQIEFPLELAIPKKTKNWGHFNGSILIKSNYGEEYSVAFTLHIPSWIEKIGYIVTPVAILLIIGFVFLLITWSNLKAPEGILYTIRYPTGSFMMDDIKLSRVKRGLLSRHINWKKNQITLGNFKSDLFLNDLPASSSIRIKLIFFRFGRDYIKNDSSLKDCQTDDDEINDFDVCDSEVGVDLNLKPGKSYSLTESLEIKVGDYVFRYKKS